MLKLLERIAEKVGAITKDDPTLQVLEQATRPEKLVEQIVNAAQHAATKPLTSRNLIDLRVFRLA